jgi:hypothetical protein
MLQRFEISHAYIGFSQLQRHVNLKLQKIAHTSLSLFTPFGFPAPTPRSHNSLCQLLAATFHNILPARCFTR